MVVKRSEGGFAENAGSEYAARPGDGQPNRIPPRERVKLGDGGRFVIPAAMRAEMGVKPGDDLIMYVENGELRVRSWLGAIRRIQEKAAKLKKPGESVVDEFLRERREEQQRSDERFDRLHREGMATKKGDS